MAKCMKFPLASRKLIYVCAALFVAALFQETSFHAQCSLLGNNIAYSHMCNGCWNSFGNVGYGLSDCHLLRHLTFLHPTQTLVTYRDVRNVTALSPFLPSSTLLPPLSHDDLIPAQKNLAWFKIYCQRDHIVIHMYAHITNFYGVHTVRSYL